jgi:hypothetical protein
MSNLIVTALISFITLAQTIAIVDKNKTSEIDASGTGSSVIYLTKTSPPPFPHVLKTTQVADSKHLSFENNCIPISWSREY